MAKKPKADEALEQNQAGPANQGQPDGAATGDQAQAAAGQQDTGDGGQDGTQGAEADGKDAGTAGDPVDEGASAGDQPANSEAAAPALDQGAAVDQAADGGEAQAQAPVALKLHKRIGDEAFALQSKQGGQQDCWTLHRLDTVIGDLKTSLPDAIAVLEKSSPELAAILVTLQGIL